MPKVLITGASGFVGENLARRFERDHTVFITYGTHRPTAGSAAAFQLDLSSPGRVTKVLNALSVDVVIHTAALVNPDLCEDEPALARAINVEGTREVAQWAEDQGARVIYFSTDLVYDGQKGMYLEEDRPNPINTYGDTKLRGEEMVRKTCSDWAIIRLALSYGPTRGLRGDWTYNMRKQLKEGKDLYLYTDQFRTPAYVGDTAEVVCRLAGSSKKGIYHVGGVERLSRYEFGVTFARIFGLPVERFHPITMKDMPMKAPRAWDCSLNTDKVSRELGISLCTVEQGLTLQGKVEERLVAGGSHTP